MEFVKDVCYILGIGAYGIRRNDKISNLTGQPFTSFSIAFMRETLTEAFFLVTEHKERFLANPQHRRTSWIVESVEPTDRVEEVFCAVVEPTHEFVLEDNILTGNCLLLRALDSREGWADMMHNITMGLMTGAGIGGDYSLIRPRGKVVRKTGGIATGPIALMQMVNEAGRGIRQGGSRRSALWAGLKWSHADVQQFIICKNWTAEVRKLKEQDFDFPATLDGTNISVQLDDEFFEAYNSEKHALNSMAHQVYWTTVERMLKTSEPGFSIDIGPNRKETLRNAPVGPNTYILTSDGYQTVSCIAGTPTNVWTGQQWADDVVFQKTKSNTPVVKVAITGGRSITCDPDHEFLVNKYRGVGKRRKLVRVDRVKAKELKSGNVLHVSMPDNLRLYKPDIHVESYTLGYIYGDGTFGSAGNSDITFCTEESKLCANVVSKSKRVSSVNPRDGRGYIRIYFKVDHVYFHNRTKHIFPDEMYRASYEEKCSFLAGLLDSDGNFEPTQHRIRLASKHQQFLRGVARLLESIGVVSHVSKAGKSTYGKSQGWQLVVASDYANIVENILPTVRVKIDLGAYKPYRPSFLKVLGVSGAGTADVFCADVKVSEHSFMAEGVIISNCCELVSADDSDVCNLGSINMSKIESLEEMETATELGTAFLLAGTVYSDVPYPKVDQMRTKNRRLGLGLMGLHEWLLSHGKSYGEDIELAKYMAIYTKSGQIAKSYAQKWELSTPVKTRAIAPNGTIGIVAETTTGIEPMLCAAYKRRYAKGDTWNYQYVVDPCAKRLVEEHGINPDNLEDAYSLATDVERRVKFQSWCQQFVDHAISSTINLPRWGSEFNNENRVHAFGDMLIKYLPLLRGLTCYPDGARGGQPLNAVSYKLASKHVGEVFIEGGNICDLAKGGSCGD